MKLFDFEDTEQALENAEETLAQQDDPLWLMGLAMVVPFAAAYLGRRILGGAYEAVVKHPPPKNPASPTVAWQEALIWSVLAGATAGLFRLTARRSLALLPQHNPTREDSKKS